MQLAPASTMQLLLASRPAMIRPHKQLHHSASRNQRLCCPSRVVKQRHLVLASQSPHAAAASVTSVPKGFVDEMRRVAMKLHTKDQAPKEGGKEASPTPMSAWQPTQASYLCFLMESKVVYDTLEEIVAQNEQYAIFRNTGLERSAALATDIAWLGKELGVKGQVASDGPGTQYAALLRDLAVSDPPAFICHYYNFYFAHTAGGRMIGNKVAGMILNNKQLAFYQWDGDVKAMLDTVRGHINKLAEAWDRQQKDHCLEETESSFKYSGKLLRLIFTTS